MTKKKPKRTSSLPLGKEGKAVQKTIDGKKVLFGTPDKRIQELAKVHVESLESAEDIKTSVKESKAALHKALEEKRQKNKLAWVRTQSERRPYKFSATAKFELKTEKEG